MTIHRTPGSAGRRRALAAALALPIAGAAGSLRAQAWPARDIRLVLPSGAGGGADVFGRPLGEFLARSLGVPVVVENRPGANGIVAHETVLRAPADGHTLLISFSAAYLVNRLLMAKMSHDPMSDFAPVGRIGGGGGNVLIVNPAVPVRTLSELVAHAAAQGGRLSYGSWGIGSGGHLVMEMIKARTGMPMEHVPYKTVAQIAPAVVGGEIGVAWIDSATPVGLIRSGRLRAIAVAAQARLPQLPEVPTLNEQGVPMNVTSWYGMFVAKGTPAPVVERMNALLNQWLRLPDTVAFFEQKQNAPAPTPTTPAEFARVLQADLEGWKKMVADARLTPS
ncbi:MAG: tripartite tricarboxylate transporter substrate binding protein [Burkholderiales bacterium]|nr:tripartite tricarboxylate transporter substrate binding protein [Burkholderiales bacterium]